MRIMMRAIGENPARVEPRSQPSLCGYVCAGHHSTAIAILLTRKSEFKVVKPQPLMQRDEVSSVCL